MSKEIDLYVDLETMQPNILRFWNYLENSYQHPHRISFLNDDVYQWKCDSGHVFNISIFQMFYYYKVLKMSPCPQCHVKWKDKGLKNPEEKNHIFLNQNLESLLVICVLMFQKPGMFIEMEIAHR